MNVKISDLKARLSAHLRRVRKGGTVTVLDRKTPVARLVPHAVAPEGLRLSPASSPVSAIGKGPGVPLRRRVDVARVLDETREER